MMTQPIQMFENLTSETSPAGGNALTKMGFSFEDHRLIARAVAAVKADFKLRAAEAQLHRMSDRELSDLGLCRADIPFAVRERVEGVMPQFDVVTGHATPANQNVRRAA